MSIIRRDLENIPISELVFCKHEFGYDVLFTIKDVNDMLYGVSHEDGNMYDIEWFVPLKDLLHMLGERR